MDDANMEMSFDEQKRLGARIRHVRLGLGLTQEKLGEISEISAGYVAQVETGTAMPSIPALLRIANALAVPVSGLVSALDQMEGSAGADLRAQATALLAGCDISQLQLAVRLIAALRAGDEFASNPGQPTS